MGLLTILIVVIVAFIAIGVVLGKLAWERAIMLLVVVCIVAMAAALLIGQRL